LYGVQRERKGWFGKAYEKEYTLIVAKTEKRVKPLSLGTLLLP